MPADNMFGPELRRRRMKAGLSLDDMARLVHYNKGHISKVERGLRRPSDELARDCDAVLRADGALAALHYARPSRSRGLDLERDADLIEAGPALPMLIDPSLAESYVAIFGHVRRVGQATAAETALASAHSLRSTIGRLYEAGGPAQDRLRLLGARCAEFIGWMYQEQGNMAAAQRFTSIAGESVDWVDMRAYSWVRQAEISIAIGDAPNALRLAGLAAEELRAATRVRALANHRMAQAYALQRKASACYAALDRAQRLFERDDEEGRGLGLGTSTVPDICAATAGWCQYELGQHAIAVEALADVVARIPEASRRARGVFGGRLSLSYAASDAVAEACATGRMVLSEVEHTRSAGGQAELRQLTRYLRRWTHDSDAQELYIDVVAALSNP